MDLKQTTAVDLVRDLHNGTLSAETLMEASLTQISRENPTLNAIVAQCPAEDLLAKARMADQIPSENRGPLHGLPIAIKDLANVRGMVTSQGSPIFANNVAGGDDVFVSRIRAAGAIIIGKTNTPEFGLGSNTFNPVYGATTNIADVQRTAGGSSGGAAVALAAGMIPIADGSDMMGSLRNPAGWNGVYGFRPTWGRVPSEPVGDVFLHQLSTNGPMGRSPADIALLLDVMAGSDPRLPLSRDYEPVQPLPEGQPLRLGWLGDWGGAYATEPGVMDVCEGAIARLEAMGHKVDRLPPPFPAEKLWQAWSVLRSFAVAAGLRALAPHRDRLKQTAIWELERGLAFGAQEIQAASDLRSAWMRAVARLWQTVDLLLLPTAQCWPFPISEEYPTEINGTPMDSYHRWMEVTVPVSLIGLPCLAVPAGTDARGLHMGLQIIGPHGHDRQILSMGQAYHQARRGERH